MRMTLDPLPTSRRRQNSGSQSTTMRPADKSTERTYDPWTKGISRPRVPSLTTTTSLAPVANRWLTRPSSTLSVVTTSSPSRSTQYYSPFAGGGSCSRATWMSVPINAAAWSRSSTPGNWPPCPCPAVDLSRRRPLFPCLALHRAATAGNRRSACAARRRIRSSASPARHTARRCARSGRADRLSSCSGGRLLLAGFLDQGGDLVAHLRTLADPLLHARHVQLQTLVLAGGDRIVEADVLDVAAVALAALIGHHDVVERTALCATARKTNLDHGKTPEIAESAAGARESCAGNGAF